jgi:predicted glycosyltransferase involved in capsule biosynthesis
MNAYKSKDVLLVSNFAKMVLVLPTYKTVKTLLVLPIFHTNVLTVSVLKKKTIVMIISLDAHTTKDLNAQTDSVLTSNPTVMKTWFAKMV